MAQYVRSLDGIRAIAVILVMLFHYRIYDFGSAGVGVGWIGVQLFFVLSGFLITRILLEDKNHSFKFYLKKFYWRRSLRIFPLYFGYLLVISSVFFVTKQPAFLGDMLAFLYTYTFNFTRLFPDWQHSPLYTHLWSLSVEEQFYLLWPFLIYLCSERLLKTVVVTILIVGPVFRWVLGYYLLNFSGLSVDAAGEAIYWFTVSHLDAFAMGGAIPVFRLHEKVLKPGKWLTCFTIILLMAGGLNALAISSHKPNFDFTSLGFPIGNMSYKQHVWSYTLLNITFASLILYLLSLQGRKSLLTSSVMVSIGRVSYGIYLFHWAILAVFSVLVERMPVTVPSIVLFICYFLMVYGVALLSFNYYEKTFLKLKGHISGKRQNSKAHLQTDNSG